MAKYTTSAPYIASFCIFQKDDKIAFVKRAHTQYMNGYYGLPAGRVEWGEAFSAAAIREAKEEVGVDIKPEHVRHALTVHRHSQDTEWVDAYFIIEQWDGDLVNAEPDVHDELVWLSLGDLPDNVVPEVRFALEQVAASVRYAEYGWEVV